MAELANSCSLTAELISRRARAQRKSSFYYITHSLNGSLRVLWVWKIHSFIGSGWQRTGRLQAVCKCCVCSGLHGTSVLFLFLLFSFVLQCNFMFWFATDLVGRSTFTYCPCLKFMHGKRLSVGENVSCIKSVHLNEEIHFIVPQGHFGEDDNK